MTQREPIENTQQPKWPRRDFLDLQSLYCCSLTTVRIGMYMYKQSTCTYKQLQQIEKKVGMEYQKAYKQG